ncbi:ABC transporter permease subunit [Gracilibacillus salitolerans]|uniref:ABC transporter permease subunit n=1 Tax=Gracilibacillus salitolerans TaxID=2663022 RepID=A0A5Q2TRU2_9BACI|nr:ABC transporter permease subunit [Gracilibacillus salitolerans]QGH36941.1 ABC transporter permease subunit [Gracilibacillus salitolerans]
MNEEMIRKNSIKLKRKKRFKQNIPLLLIFFPVIIFYLTFKYAPIMGNIIAFKEYNFFDGIFGSPWVGFHNFELLFTQTQTLNIIRNTLMLSVLQLVFGFPAPIILAILLNEVRKMFFKRTIQTIVYLPHFFNWVIIGGIVLTLFSMESGFINHWIERWTGEPYPFLYKPLSWIGVFISSGIWKEMGFGTIIYLAVIGMINPSLYESASIDGANKFRQIWHITLPQMRPTIIILFILATGNVMEVGFDQVYMLQNPVVSNVAEVISTYIYRVGLLGAQFSLSAAMGLFEALVGLVLVLSANWIARKFDQGLF